MGATRSHALDQAELVSLIDAAARSKQLQPVMACNGATAFARPGLTIVNGVVSASETIAEIGGYAGAAGTTGGLGGRLLVVTTMEDYDPSHEQPISGSLRAHIDSAKRDKTPAWIVFSQALGSKARIELKATLRLPSNMTIDGSCSDITLEAPDHKNITFAQIANGVGNVIITRLAMRKSGYVPELHSNSGSAIVVNGDFDRIAILHNDFSACGHSCLDVTVSPGKEIPVSARITVAYNYFRDHDKVMLFGTFDCPQRVGLNTCDRAYFERHKHSAPGLYLTLEGNLFLGTGQRQPRVFGRASAHILNNLVAFHPLVRADGQRQSTYGVFVSNGARALVEENIFAPMGDKPSLRLAVWTVKTRGALQMPADTEGFVRLGRNTLISGALASEYMPAEVGRPEYKYIPLILTGLPLEVALACFEDRAGRAGSIAWDREKCSLER